MRLLRRAFQLGQYRFVSKTIKTPAMGESITEGTLTQWHKKVGEFVARDEQVATIETDKIDVQVNSPEHGTITDLLFQEGETVSVGGDLFKLELGEAPLNQKTEPPKVEPPKIEKPVEKVVEKPAPVAAPPKPAPAAAPKQAPKPATVEQLDIPGLNIGLRTEKRVKMNRMRLRIAERLKESQNIAASLTTFNEIDMSNLMQLRSKYKDLVLDKHAVKLGFMGAFVKASVYALQQVPAVNARIEGDNMVYSDFVDVSVAVATPKGLVTPVLRNCETLSIVQVEKALGALGKKARDNAITLEDMQGGTFTISNGGVFGSLYGTPIINAPQSAILGMHAIKERPVVVDGKIEIRPMMYVALTYDHRIIDGREAVTFLVKVKEAIEDPARLLLEV